MLFMAEVVWWQRVKSRIEQLGLSPYAVAKAAGLSRPAIVNIMAGDTKYPRLETIKAIARALEVSETWILEGDAHVLAEDRATYSATNESAARWERFARHFKAGDPEEFAKTVADLPQNEQAIVARLARLLAIEPKLG